MVDHATSTGIIAPLILLDRSEERKMSIWATSSGEMGGMLFSGSSLCTWWIGFIVASASISNVLVSTDEMIPVATPMRAVRC